MKTLVERVKAARVTHRLTNSPACLVSGEGNMSANLERLFKAAGQAAPSVKPTLENSSPHALVTRLDQDKGVEYLCGNDWDLRYA